MGRLPEHHGKDLLARHGIRVPRGEVVRSADDAVESARALGSNVVVKALVPHNRRAKAGGIRFPVDLEEVEATAGELLGTTILGSDVDTLLVEERLEPERELFLSFAIDRDRRLPVALASLSGGVDIEETLERDPGAIRSVTLDPWGRDLGFRLRTLWSAVGLEGTTLLEVAELSRQAARLFFSVDADVLELNPLALVAREDGSVEPVAIGVVLGIDEFALARQPSLAPLVESTGDRLRLPTQLEREALEVAAREPYRGTARFMELEGEIGLLVGGGGGSLVFFDAVRRAGACPACFTEIGGNPTSEKVRGLARVVLSCPGVEGLLVGHNITNNTQCDLVAEGVVAALADLGLSAQSFPVVAREVGTHDERGRRIFEDAGIEYLGEEATLEAAARRIVERVHLARMAVT